MPSLAFVTGDFKVFDVEGFRPRMAELRSRVRPKLEVLGKSLAPAVSRSLGGEVFAHVAKHARRTVNPPDDTWVAFSPDARGYKKHCHFKVAVSPCRPRRRRAGARQSTVPARSRPSGPSRRSTACASGGRAARGDLRHGRRADRLGRAPPRGVARAARRARRRPGAARLLATHDRPPRERGRAAPPRASALVGRGHATRRPQARPLRAARAPRAAHRPRRHGVPRRGRRGGHPVRGGHLRLAFRRRPTPRSARAPGALRRGRHRRRRAPRQARPGGVPARRAGDRRAAPGVPRVRGVRRRRPGGAARGHARDRRRHGPHRGRAARGRCRLRHRRLRGARVAGVSTPEFWTDLYTRGGDGWELGRPAPTLAAFLESTHLPPGRVAVPGCGRGHDVRHLVRRGYMAVGFDFAPAAITEAKARAKAERVAAEFEQRDIFTLDRDYANAFDGVWEYTCFCAIDPARRAQYVRTMAAILRPGGWLLACFYPIRRPGGGPPFPVARSEVRRLFAGPFRIERTEVPLHSVERRQGQEWMVLFRKTG